MRVGSVIYFISLVTLILLLWAAAVDSAILTKGRQPTNDSDTGVHIIKPGQRILSSSQIQNETTTTNQVMVWYDLFWTPFWNHLTRHYHMHVADSIASGVYHEAARSHWSKTWNSLLRADGLFPKKFDKIQHTTHYIPDAVEIFKKLKFLLANSTVLDLFYKNYKIRYHHQMGGPGIWTKAERRRRKKLFVRNVLKIAQHNIQYEAGGQSWRQGVNQFTSSREGGSLRMDFEFENVTALSKPFEHEVEKMESSWHHKLSDPPSAIDWRVNGVVDFLVRDQGRCGSCSYFASISLLEAAVAKTTGQLVDLSEQELIDCTKEKYGNSGCGGGNYGASLTYLKRNGVAIEIDYGYESNETSKSGTCRSSSSSNKSNLFEEGNYGMKRVFGIRPLVFDIQGDEDILKMAVWHFGPIGMTANVGVQWFQYDGGVMDDWMEHREYPHSFVIVGYGREKGKDYWLVRNSFGRDWGENGYIKLSRDKGTKKLRHHRVFGIGVFFSEARIS